MMILILHFVLPAQGGAIDFDPQFETSKTRNFSHNLKSRRNFDVHLCFALLRPRTTHMSIMAQSSSPSSSLLSFSSSPELNSSDAPSQTTETIASVVPSSTALEFHAALTDDSCPPQFRHVSVKIVNVTGFERGVWDQDPLREPFYKLAKVCLILTIVKT